jgi:solute carrier family 35 (UDP-galactose transporter), member B1
MLLSVFIYNHQLTLMQWIGVAIVFAGIGIEAREKRREGLAKKVLHDEKKALAKDA